ncbi:DUF5348 domain-containing protein [Clostridium botulinum]|uniref:DUF5348 domain-containing protein n=1 Tax=Clostridium botulinum TaxID=1491 RepID=UPI001E5FEDB9|nr:DUF5348 domain-containing protein [Clostridium botulinum]MCD3223820.1 DUF5348 domain-containing protein [Clostridium botulinum C/D]MCD3295280.1 DUF5348 domain-containing protein [Clostridium botulinum C/D]
MGLNKDFLDILSIVKDAQHQIEKKYKNTTVGEEFENQKVAVEIEHLLENLDSFIHSVKYYNSSAIKGTLSFNVEDERYSLNGETLSCGSTLEVFLDEYHEWEIGTVEHSKKFGGYYFCGDWHKIPLSNVTKCRLRR